MDQSTKVDQSQTLIQEAREREMKSIFNAIGKIHASVLIYGEDYREAVKQVRSALAEFYDERQRSIVAAGGKRSEYTDTCIEQIKKGAF